MGVQFNCGHHCAPGLNKVLRRGFGLGAQFNWGLPLCPLSLMGQHDSAPTQGLVVFPFAQAGETFDPNKEEHCTGVEDSTSTHAEHDDVRQFWFDMGFEIPANLAALDRNAYDRLRCNAKEWFQWRLT